MREVGVVVEGETVEGWPDDPSKETVKKVMGGGSIGTFTKKGEGTEVRFFLERKLRPPPPPPQEDRCRKFKKLSDFQSKVRMFNHKLRGLGLEGAAAKVTTGP